MNRTLHSAMFGASILAVSLAAGCSRSEFAESTAPRSAYVEPPSAPAPTAPAGRIQTTELLGGPAPAAAAAPAAQPWSVSVPPASAEAGYGTMAPIANPEDMSPAQRSRVYAENTAASAGAYGSPAYAAPSQAARVDGQRTVRRARQANRPTVSTSARPAIASPAGPVTRRPVAPAPRPAAPAPVIAAKPAAPAAKSAAPAAKPAAPVVAPVGAAKPAAPATATTPPVPAKPVNPATAAAPAKPPVPVAPARPQTKAEQLGAALAADVATGLKFDIPANLVTGQDSIVTATLPEGLLERAQAEAAKLGLTVPARSIDARAVLSGEGYTFVPNVAQMARLQKGEASTFSWQVRPTGEAREPLKLEIGGELKGGAKSQAFPITTIEKAVVAPAPAQPAAKKGFVLPKFLRDLFAGRDKAPQAAPAQAPAAAKGPGILERFSIPGRETVVTPVFGEVKSSNVVLGGIGVLLAILLAAMAGRASARRKAAERRRKFRTMADFGASGTEAQSEPEPAPQPVYRAPEAPVAEAPAAQPVQVSEEPSASSEGLSRGIKTHDDTPVVRREDENARRAPEHV